MTGQGRPIVHHPLVVHCKREPFDVYIGRPGPFGNPFPIGPDGDREAIIEQYIQWLKTQPALVERIRSELRGKRLGCYCAPKLCHGDVLALIANSNL